MLLALTSTSGRTQLRTRVLLAYIIPYIIICASCRAVEGNDLYLIFLILNMGYTTVLQLTTGEVVSFHLESFHRSKILAHELQAVTRVYMSKSEYI